MLLNLDSSPILICLHGLIRCPDFAGFINPFLILRHLFACLQDTNSYMGRILAKEPTLQASFKRAAGAMKKDDTPRFVLVRFLPFYFFFCRVPLFL